MQMGGKVEDQAKQMLPAERTNGHGAAPSEALSRAQTARAEGKRLRDAVPCGEREQWAASMGKVSAEGGPNLYFSWFKVRTSETRQNSASRVGLQPTAKR